MKELLRFNAQFLVAVISLSLAGIIGLQAYLFRSAILVRDARFKAEVAEALDRVGNRLEALEASRMLATQMKGNDILPREQDFLIDSVLIFNRSGENYTAKDTFFFGKNSFVHHSFEIMTDTSSKDAINNAFSLKAAERQLRYKQFVEQRLRRMDTIFRQMISQGMGGYVQIENRFTFQEIDSVINSELAREGLMLPYQFAILEDGDLSGIHTPDYNGELPDFKVPIYRNDFFRGPKWLLISFPDRIAYLLSTMWYMLALSGFFTAVIIIAFGYTVNQMLKQKKISQIKSDFISNMTHEFKTPIATINLAVDALSNPKVKDNPERLAHFQEVIREENKRMHAQVEKVLQLALLDKQELELNLTELDVHDILENAINSLYLQFEKRQAEIILNFDAEKLLIKGDELHLTNVMVNVLDNALKYSSENPVISVNTRNVQDLIEVFITDNGQGMTKEVQRRIFERFYRETKGNIHDVKGHGLGLSYVKEILEMHRGSIRVESSPGKGSTFYIQIPLINDKTKSR